MELKRRTLEFMPIQLFAIIMGLSGFAIMFAKAYHVFGVPYWIYTSILFIDTVVFLVILTAYMFKLLLFTDAVKKEFYHPVKSSFMAAISISFLLLSIAFYDYAPTLSVLLWYIGAPLQMIFTLIIMYYWIRNDLEVVHSSPAWFIPIVGNILVPIVGVETAPIYVSLFFFSIGMMFWIVLFSIMIYRIIFHHPLAKKLVPTLFIFIAPPAVGFISYFRITNGSIDIFSIFLYSIALFILVLLLIMIRMYDTKEFFVSWWAYTFPLAAVSIATIMMHRVLDNSITYLLSIILTGLTTLVVSYVVYRTLQACRAQKICIEEEQ